MLRVVEVRSLRRVLQFLELPHRVYAAPDSPWVAPLRLHVLMMMGWPVARGKRFWLALDGERPVARLGAQVHGEALHWGFFECLPEGEEAVPALFEAARSLAPGKVLRGPFHFAMEDAYTGVLVEGFAEEPSLLCPWNPPGYDGLLRSAGLRPAMDLYSYRYDRDRVPLDRTRTRAERARAQGVEVRPMRSQAELVELFRLTNQTHRGNWGFEEYTERQMRELALLARVFLDPRGVFLAWHHGRLVGCAVVARDVNRFLKKARGRMTPGLLWDLAMRREQVDVYRGYGLGVLPEGRPLDVAGALIQAVYDASRRHPWRTLEISWVLASNGPMNALARALGGVRNKVHRVYEG